LICAVEYAASNLTPAIGMEFRWRIRAVLEKHRNSAISLMKMELKGLKLLKKNEDFMILRADKGICTLVVDKSDCLEKMDKLLSSGIYEQLKKKILQ
jgi:hypothetical protein